MLETARVLGLRRVVFASTEGVYDRAYATDVAQQLPETSPYGYNPLYGAAKASSELLGSAYADRFGVDFVALRFSALFGLRYVRRGLGSWRVHARPDHGRGRAASLARPALAGAARVHLREGYRPRR